MHSQQQKKKHINKPQQRIGDISLMDHSVARQTFERQKEDPLQVSHLDVEALQRLLDQ